MATLSDILSSDAYSGKASDFPKLEPHENPEYFLDQEISQPMEESKIFQKVRHL